jgi:hydrogenase maturation protease
MSRNQRKIVLGLGNILNRDEGVGVHALKVLEQNLERSLSEQIPVELIDGGTLGLNLLPLIEESSHLLVLDAVNAGQPPGSVIELRRNEIPLYRGIKMSEHQITFQEILGLAKFREKFPPNLRLIGIQPGDINIGIELSKAVSASIQEVVARSLAILKEWKLFM